MKFFTFILILTLSSLSAQKTLPFDTLRLGTAKDLLADDYGNIYLYQNKDFSFTKYDSLGNQKAKLMLTLPFQIQSVQNPLTIPSFSENAQEIKFFDQNLNEVQTINLRQKFGFVKVAYLEDLQQSWLLDESTKRLIQYNFRENRVVNTFAFDLDFENLLNFLVLTQDTLKTIFTAENSQIVDKNSASYFVIRENKLYLYPIEQEVRIK